MATRTKTTIERCTDIDEILVDTAFEEFLIEKNASNISPTTETNYKNSIKKLKIFIGEDKTIESVTNKVIYQWINTMKNDGIKVTSINHYLREIKSFLNWCSVKEYTKEKYKIAFLNGQEETIKTFSDAEQAKILVKPDKNANFAEHRTYAIICFVLDSGCRASTVCNVKMQDIDFKTGFITLAHTKNKKTQKVPMSSAFSSVITEYIRIWRKRAKPDEYLFCNVGEQKLTPSALRLAFGKYCFKRGVTRLNVKGEFEGKSNIHGLRHTFAKGYLMNNGNTFKLQQILGHSTLDMTRKYVALFSEDIKEGHDDFSPFAVSKQNLSRTQTVKNDEDKSA
ncbi:MAG: tyrosine-type recombinase/integrase [Oscillospiraceae bacterium]|nr:tyrosine-type recombinase/integrase [Oscillospiraceae bacterium]